METLPRCAVSALPFTAPEHSSSYNFDDTELCMQALIIGVFCGMKRDGLISPNSNLLKSNRRSIKNCSALFTHALCPKWVGRGIGNALDKLPPKFKTLMFCALLERQVDWSYKSQWFSLFWKKASEPELFPIGILMHDFNKIEVVIARVASVSEQLSAVLGTILHRYRHIIHLLIIADISCLPCFALPHPPHRILPSWPRATW